MSSDEDDGIDIFNDHTDPEENAIEVAINVLDQKESDDDPVFIESLLRDRLRRRTDLINEMRKAYLRDILSLKGFLQEFLTDDERKPLYDSWKTSLPSVDLRQHLMLYSPLETSLNMIPCDNCGGSIEIVHHESSELEALSRALSHNDKTKNDLKVVIGTKTAQLEKLERNWELESRKYRDEVPLPTFLPLRPPSPTAPTCHILATEKSVLSRDQRDEATDGGPRWRV
jgi:hypothetical protein